MNGQHIVILGGGFAGVELARRLERLLPKEHSISLLSKENYITYNPLLAETVGASILPGHVVAPLRQMVRRTRFCMVTVTDIDIDRRELHYLGEGSGIISYDQLVLACGLNANLDVVPGMATYGLPLKTLGDALFLRNRIMARLEHADMQPHRELRRWLTTFVVVGGGFSGVEVAGEINDFLRSAMHYYPRITREDPAVVLVHGGERILPELSPLLGTFALKKMRRQGIDVRLNAAVARVEDTAVLLAGGERIRGGTVICTVGTAPGPLLSALPLAAVRGRIVVNADMSVPDHTGLWALGDCAAVPNAFDQRLSPPTAQFAVRQAQRLAQNIAASLSGRPVRPFRYRPQGALSSIGRHKAVAEIFGLRVYGFLAWLLWRAVYLSKMPTLARKVRLFMEWNWEMLFPPDIVHLRYSRTRRPKRQSLYTGATTEMPRTRVAAGEG